MWDIGRVLVQWDFPAIWREVIADRAELDRFVTQVVNEAWHARHDAGVPMADLIAEAAAAHPDQADLIARYRTHWLLSVPGPIAGTQELVARLSARAVPQYAITNFGHETFALFRPTFPVLDHMRDIVVSGTERLIKPDPAIFRLAAARFGHDPARMLFVDDNADNIAAARALGWQVHHFVDGAEALEMDLRGRGLI